MKRKAFINNILALSLSTLNGKESRKMMMPIATSYTSNPDLKTILEGWKGTPLDQDGRFINHQFPFVHRFGTVLKWMLETNPQKAEKKADTWQKQVLQNTDFLDYQADCIVWLGHASFYIQLAGKKILIDPVFEGVTATKRLTKLPVDKASFKDIDYVLVSHSHYDHCDKDSLKLLAKLNPKAQFFAGLKLNTLIEKWIGRPVQTAGWYQEYKTDDNVQLFFVPSRHWSNRSLGDINETLWGGFVLKSDNKTLYFGGDSGYGNHFEQIGKLFPNLDVAMIGAGAYSPKWFMAPNHQDPADALIAFKDTKAKALIPFHYGTFDVSDEPISEAEKLLNQGAVSMKISEKLKLLNLGQIYNFS